LNAGARASLARSLADEVARQVSPLPPPGLSAELYLGVVLAERSRRAQEDIGGTSPPPGAQRPPSWATTVEAEPAPSDGAAEPGDFTAPS
jgi:hypothetical protein